MVSAVSSQAATLNPLAYTGQTDDDTATQSASNTTANDNDRGPATQVSVSQAAMDLIATLKQGGTISRQAMDAFEQTSQDAAHASLDAAHASLDTAHAAMEAKRDAVLKKFDEKLHQFEINKANFKIDFFDQQQETNARLTDTIKMLNEHAAKWASTTPVPAVQLTDAQITAILKKVAPLGIDPSKIGGADNYAFGYEGMMYTFKKDGTAWVNQGGVPISEEQKQIGIQSFAHSIQEWTSKIQHPAVSREDLVAQRDALVGQQSANA